MDLAILVKDLKPEKASFTIRYAKKDYDFNLTKATLRTFEFLSRNTDSIDFGLAVTGANTEDLCRLAYALMDQDGQQFLMEAQTTKYQEADGTIIEKDLKGWEKLYYIVAGDEKGTIEAAFKNKEAVIKAVHKAIDVDGLAETQKKNPHMKKLIEKAEKEALAQQK